jgi:hypothetical protein
LRLIATRRRPSSIHPGIKLSSALAAMPKLALTRAEQDARLGQQVGAVAGYLPQLWHLSSPGTTLPDCRTAPHIRQKIANATENPVLRVSADLVHTVAVARLPSTMFSSSG